MKLDIGAPYETMLEEIGEQTELEMDEELSRRVEMIIHETYQEQVSADE